MKRMISICLILIVLVLPACTAMPSDSNESLENNAQQLKVSNNIVCMNYSEYQDYVATQDLLEGFVTWEKVSQLGMVEYLIIYSADQYTHYCYSYYDEKNIRMSIEFYHDPSTWWDSFSQRPTSSVTPEMTSMSQNSFIGFSRIQRNGYEYIYNRYGNLLFIRWMNNGIACVISEEVYDYPESTGNTKSLVQRLLSVNAAEADAAFAEITSKLATE